MFHKKWVLILLVAITSAGVFTVFLRPEVTSSSVLSPPRPEVDWPPKLNQAYPDLELINHAGQSVRMSDFKGKVIVLEYVGMTCAACQAFSGAHKRGAYGNIVPQSGLRAIKEYFPRYTGGLSLEDERIVFIQMLLYSMSMGAPTPGDARNWAQHFQLDRAKNHIVLAGKEELLGQASYDMIPGFQLIDKQFILRSDSTGHYPRHNLWTELLPMVPQLLKEGQ